MASEDFPEAIPDLNDSDSTRTAFFFFGKNQARPNGPPRALQCKVDSDAIDGLPFRQKHWENEGMGRLQAHAVLFRVCAEGESERPQ